MKKTNCTWVNSFFELSNFRISNLSLIFVFLFSLNLNGQVSTKVRTTPLPPLKSPTEVKTILTNEVSSLSKQYDKQKAFDRKSPEMIRALLIGHLYEKTELSKRSINEAFLTAYTEVLDLGKMTKQEKINAYYSRNWPSAFNEVVNLLKK